MWHPLRQKGTARENAMDVKLYLALVQEHTAQLRRLSTELSNTFWQLEQELDEAQGPLDTNAVSLLDAIAEFTNSLFCAEDIFGRRLQRFLESTKIATGSALIN
jgi:hypothetical protein